MTVAKKIYNYDADNFYRRVMMAYSQAVRFSVETYKELRIIRFIFIDGSVLVHRHYYGDLFGLVAVEG